MTLLVLERSIFYSGLTLRKREFFFLVHLSVVSKSFSSLLVCMSIHSIAEFVCI